MINFRQRNSDKDYYFSCEFVCVNASSSSRPANRDFPNSLSICLSHPLLPAGLPNHIL